MKLFLILLAVLALLWLLRSGLRSSGTAAPKAPPPSRPLPMLVCAQCGVHLPINEALPGRGGAFCGDAHRTAYESAHPE